jgi:hypothetical protein
VDPCHPVAVVRYRVKLGYLHSGLKAQVHTILAKASVTVPVTDLIGKRGQLLLDEIPLPMPTGSGSRAYGM